jgi:hypothetical protein
MSPVIHTPTWIDEEEFLPDEVVALIDAYMSTERGTLPAVISTNCIEGMARIHKRGFIRRVKVVKPSAYNLTGRVDYYRMTKLGLKVATEILGTYRRAIKKPLDLAG